jgi:hypothetical protein
MGDITKDYRQAALRHGVVIRSRAKDTSDELVYAAVLEMANYGYRVSPDDLRGMSTSALTNMLSDARAIKGADRDMTPVYPGFPKQVQELDTLTLLIEQIMHYWTAGAFLPDHPTVVREGLPLEDILANVQEVAVMEAGPAACHFITTLTSRGVALSEAERALLHGSVAVAHPDIEMVKSAIREARNGENIQVLINALLSEGVLGENDVVTNFSADMRNVDQLLRLLLSAMGTPLAAYESEAVRARDNLSDKDAFSLQMASLSRPARRAVMHALGELTDGFYADRLVLRNRLWRRVMRSVHPYSQIALTDKARRAADVIHGNIEYRTLDSLVESALNDGDVSTVIALLSENRPGELLSRCTELLRASGTRSAAKELATAVESAATGTPVSTMIRAFNGIIAANFDGVRVVREAGRNNHLLNVKRAEVKQSHIDLVSGAVLSALRVALAKSAVPNGTVGVLSDMAVPLVRRDLSNTDRVVDRGSRWTPSGSGRTLRVFSHWTNTHTIPGYLDVGVALLDEDFTHLATTTWNSWSNCRDWSTYSGDKFVYPGKSAVEFFDINLDAVCKQFPSAKLAVMTVQSYSGIPLSKVDMVAGTMLRSNANKGGSFDARTVTSAFAPTTDALQALPLAFDLDTNEMVWLDASSGSVQTGVSAAQDYAIGPVVRDELSRPRLTMGELAALWADAHGVKTVDSAVDRDAVLALLD